VVLRASSVADLKEIAALIEAGSLSKEVRRISRAVRLTVALRRLLAARDVAAFLAFALPPSSEAFARLSALVPKVLLLWNWTSLSVLTTPVKVLISGCSCNLKNTS
jgi:hypothetical protein